MTAELVAKMSVATATNLRDKLDKAPAKELPGADHLGSMRALRAYRVFRPLLTARIGDNG